MSEHKNPIVKYFLEFKVLGTVSKDFWFTNGIQFFEGLAYFSMIHIITIYLTQNCGFNDYDSGYWVSAYTLFVTTFVFAIGAVCDLIGIKKSFITAACIMLVARFFLAYASDMDMSQCFFEGLNESWKTNIFPEFLTSITNSKLMAMVSLITLSFGTAFMGPVTQAALRRFTSKKNRAAGFNIYYLLMNVSAFVASYFIIEGCRDHWGTRIGTQMVMYLSFFAAFGVLLFSLFINERNFADKEDEINLDMANKPRPLHIFKSVWREKPFQKLLVFLVLSLGVRLVFTLQFLIFPKYYLRVLYTDFPIGSANAINPAIIVLGLILLIPIIGRYSTVRLMIVGMSISALSLVLMILPVEWIMQIPGIHTVSQAYVFVIFTQIVMFAIGELLFNPRFTEYVASVAPKDKVASYMAISALPMFIAKPINGIISGLLVSYFCFEGIRAKMDVGSLEYGDTPQFMWLLYFLFALSSPIAVILLNKWLTKDNPHRDGEPLTEEAENAAFDATMVMEPNEQEGELGMGIHPKSDQADAQV